MANSQQGQDHTRGNDQAKNRVDQDVGSDYSAIGNEDDDAL